MKKICFVTTVSLTLKSFVVETAKYLHNVCGYDVTLICNNDEQFAASLPEYIHYIPVPMSRGIDLSGFASVLKFYKVFKKEKFDLIQYSTPNAACYASIAAFAARVPIRLYAQWGIRYIGLSGVTGKIFKLIEKLVCRLSTHIRAVSPMNMQFAISEGLYPSSKAKVIGNGGTIGVDMTDYDIEKKNDWRNEIRSEYNMDDTDFVFGFAGRVSADKGCAELFTAFKRMAESYKNAKLLVVGPLEENCGISQSLIEWAEKSPNVILTGKVENKDMKRYYAAMNVLVHPTYREGFGMVIQEAGALAVPVITTKISGASEVMEEGASCILVKPKNADEIYSALYELFWNREKAENMGNSAYARTKALYDRPIMLENQRKEYTRLLKGDEDFVRIVLSDKNIEKFNYPEDTDVKTVSFNELDKYDNNEKVVAIAGSRAMAIKCADMNLPSLKLFQLTSAGFDGVPLEKLAEKGVAVANAGSVYSAPIAETVVFGILQTAKRLRKNPNNRRLKLYRHYSQITEIRNKKILIMGAGNIGTAVADRLSGFDAVIDAYDPYCIEKPQYSKILRTREELLANLENYDYIVSTLPDNDETRGSINKELFDCMKKSAIIINVGRKAVFNENDFYYALKSKKIGGAVLDMFEKLPNPLTNKFRRLKNTVVLPGVSAISCEVNGRLKDTMYKNIYASLNGEAVSNVINGVK